MKKTIIFLCVLMTTNLLFAQTGLKLGASFNYAPSTLLNASNPHDETGLDFNFKLKNSIGGQLDFAYFIKPNLSLIASAGYLQRGARFADSEADYLPRYRFSYLDVSLGAAYHLQTENKVAPFVSASVAQHNLLNALIKNSFEETDIISDISKTDIGVLIALGTDYKLSENHTLQFSIFYNQGFLNVFNGIYRENGLKAYNSVIGLRIGYNFGLNLLTKEN